jgi:hypothetical protein
MIAIDLLRSGHLSRQGVYCVALYKSGMWVPIIVDDRFPVSCVCMHASPSHPVVACMR